jgi:hypothetical protein
MVIAGKMIHKTISECELGIIGQVMRKPYPVIDCDKLSKNSLLFSMNIGPHSPFIGKPCLVKITCPYLVDMGCIFNLCITDTVTMDPIKRKICFFHIFNKDHYL